MSIWPRLIFVTIRILTNRMMRKYISMQRCLKYPCSHHKHEDTACTRRTRRKGWHCVLSKVHRMTFMLKSISFLHPEFTGREEIAAKSILADAYLYTYPCPFWAVFLLYRNPESLKTLLQSFYIIQISKELIC